MDFQLAVGAGGADGVEGLVADLDGFEDFQGEGDAGAGTAYQLGDLDDGFGAEAAAVDLADSGGGDDGAGDGVGEVGMGVPGALAAAFGAVEEEELRGDVDRALFGEGDLGDGGAFADQGGAAVLEGRGRGGGLELALFADGDAPGVLFTGLVGFDEDFADGGRVAAVAHLDFARGVD